MPDVDANGQPREPTPSEADLAFAAALAWLPYWSDRQRGLLRNRLTRSDMVRRENITVREIKDAGRSDN